MFADRYDTTRVDSVENNPHLTSSAMKEYAYIHEEGQLPELFNNIPFLESFRGQQLDDILYSSYFLECEPGDIIIEEGQQDSRIFILLTGEAEVKKKDEVVARIEKSGEVFGEMAILHDERRYATVVATSPVLCLAIDQKFLNETKPEERKENASYYAAFYGFLSRVLARRLKGVTEQLAKVEHELEELKDEKL
jgi:signal-transduction protein with cAMP-binding, CBS, and nucleotidyltransferase domain